MTLRRLRRPRLVSLEERLTPSVPTSWAPRGAGGGGALYAPNFGWLDANQMSIASDMSQVFRSADGGTNWAMVNHSELQGNHYAKINFTNDPNIQYCLDYSLVDLLETTRPSKTTDGGATWTALAADPTGGEAYNLFADPQNPSRVIVSSYTEMFFSSNGGTSFTSKAFNSGGLHLAGAFFDGVNIYVGTERGLYVSTNSGTSFALSSATGIPATEAMVSFAGAKAGGITRLFAVTLGSGDVYGGITGADYGGFAGVYNMEVGLSNWERQTTGIPTSSYPFFVGSASNDANTAYVGGGSDDGMPVVYKTTDGGTTWTSVLLTTGNKNVQTGWSGQGGDRGWGYGEYVLGLAVAPQDSSRVLITDLGFGHLTIDGGTTWQAKYVAPADLNPMNANTPTGKAYHSSGLDNTTSWSLAWADANTMILGNSDVKGQRSTDGGATWGFGYTGHSMNSMYRSLRHPSSGTLYAATATVHDMYQSTYLQDSRIDGGDGEVRFSTNGGATWQLLHDFNHPVVWVASDPTNSNRLYASVIHSTQGGIYVSNNVNLGSSSTWTKVNNPPRTEGHPFNIAVLNDGDLVVTYSGRRNSGGTFTASSGVFVSENGGTSWTDRSHSGMQYWTKDIVIDPTDPTQQTWFVGVWSGWGGAPNGLGGLYKTTNGGANWTKVNNLDRVTSITFDPLDSNAAYLTTETEGLWHAENIHVANPTWTPVASYPFRQPERVFFNPFNPGEVWVTSFGGGLMVGASDTPPAVSVTQVNDGSAQRSMITSLQVSFSEAVTLTPNAFTLTGPGGPVSYVQTITSPSVITLTFPSLADGLYSLALPAANVTDGGGLHLTSPYAFNFHRLFGDSDGDRDVDATDFGAFRTAFGTNSITFDFDGDGDVDTSDFGQFRTRFGMVI